MHACCHKLAMNRRITKISSSPADINQSLHAQLIFHCTQYFLVSLLFMQNIYSVLIVASLLNCVSIAAGISITCQHSLSVVAMEFFTGNSSIDRDRISVDDADQTSFGWLLSSPCTTASKMDPSTLQQLQTSHSYGSNSLGTKERLAACRVSSRELQHHLFSSSDTEETPEGFSESSLSDTSFDDENIYPLYCSTGESCESRNYKDLATFEEEARIWALWDEELHNVEDYIETNSRNQHARPRIDDRIFLPSLVCDLDVLEYNSTLYRSNAIRTPKHDYLSMPQTPRTASQKCFPSMPRHPPPPPPKDHSCTRVPNSQHNSWPTPISSKTPLPSHRSRANTVPSQSRVYPPSKLSTYMTNEYPPRTSSMTNQGKNLCIRSAPSSPNAPMPANDFMEKMQKSVFEWDSDSDDEEKVELPEWIRKLNPKRGNTHKDPLAKATAEFTSKTKKKTKSFSAIGEVLKRSLRIRRSADF